MELCKFNSLGFLSGFLGFDYQIEKLTLLESRKKKDTNQMVEDFKWEIMEEIYNHSDGNVCMQCSKHYKKKNYSYIR
ncbi:hypothetical protein X798_03332 [Onchocerca flexuosa]|uniref:Uncharacterized protein n=1 Tax=Onchocerca flexuosa TaxID=387005 RepID=A0A238BY81_9BILA|nr:hypothetical protein X798_03332 [Onchocerca flexuosa]